ncbi:MAG: GTPase Era [Elainella sp. Prado103]|jgi:GTP-binding protein Era|nr:GTPase Era [Elainella sp. Prado103]
MTDRTPPDHEISDSITPPEIIAEGLIPAAPPGFKSGFIGIIGRPNVGKSTLMNQLVGQKIAITSPIAQTTRNRLRGILSLPTAQLIFVDTPGIHKPQHELGSVLVKNARIAIDSVDVILFVVDSSVEAGGGDRYIVKWLEQATAPVILGMNKADQQPDDPQGTDRLDHSYHQIAHEQGWQVAKFSALTGAGIEELQQQVIDRLDPGPYYYPPDLVTDQPERFIMGELIREQVLALTREEVPHSVAITIDRVEEDPDITRILATVYVERDSQKGILIGKKGSMLREIGTGARQQIQKLVMGKVYLELFVKVQPKWRQSRLQLSELGYRVEE